MAHVPEDIESEEANRRRNGLHDTLHNLHELAYHEWKIYGHHLEEYACEFIGTALLVLAVVGAVAIVQAPGSTIAAMVKPMPLRLLLTGFIIATCGMLITISPFGKLSGAHLNPAVSFGFYLLRKLGPRDTALYVVSQMAGGVVGAIISRPVFGMLAREVGFAAMAPAQHISVAAAFVGEILCTLVMVYAIFYFVSHETLARWTPFMLMAVIPVLVLVDGTVSGCGMNPARWIGPAYIAHLWQAAWIYVVGPLIGALIAVIARKAAAPDNAIPVTGKLFHDINYRSVFRHDTLPTKLHVMPRDRSNPTL